LRHPECSALGCRRAQTVCTLPRAFDAKTEREVMEEILHLYENLSDEKRKELQSRLKSPASAT
jgi:hypothetical protein